MSKIAVVGTGYVGLTTGAYLAHLGHDVICADVIPEKVERMQRGEVPIVEPGLDELVAEGLREGRLSFVLGAANAAKESEFIFLAVPTPQGEDGSADLSYVQTAAREIAPVLAPNSVVINKSTVPVGSTRVVEAALGRSDVYVVSNPEFLREGSAVYDCLNPDRIVIGSEHQEAAIRVSGLFSKLQAPLIITDPASAETIKYAANAFLATKISFINAMSNVCEVVGADVKEVSLGMGYDKRIGFEFLKPGPGWGGSCFVGGETVLARRNGVTKLMTFEQLFVEVERVGTDGWEVAAWKEGDVTAAFFPVTAFTARPYNGDVVDVRTKMGRRVTTTADHPFVVSTGVADDEHAVKLAGDLSESDWLPIAQSYPLDYSDFPTGDLIASLPALGIEPEHVIVRLSDEQFAEVSARSSEIHWSRRRDVLRCKTMRLSELQAIGIDVSTGMLGTTTNGTYVPARIAATMDFWRVVGLFLAEGHISVDGDRHRICWSFHRENEQDLVDFVNDYWTGLGIKTTVRQLATTMQVSISSRVLSAFFRDGLKVGHNAYDKRVPDEIWAMPGLAKWELLRGLWDGDGSWSKVAGGPSVVLEYGTVSRDLADGMVRLLGDLGIVARLKVGRGAQSTVDTYWISISGAEQIEESILLFPDEERAAIIDSISSQSKRIAPTGYRRLSKNAAWVRVVSAERRSFDGIVFSVEVDDAHTIVTSFGLVAHNCFPKDSRALVKIAEEAGYDFGLLKGVITVNEQQYDMIAEKIRNAVGGSLEGKTIGVWGLTFKANTDDLRDSPSLYVIDRLEAAGARIKGYDVTQTSPHAPKHKSLESVEICADPYAAVDGADVLAVMTEWDEYRWLDFEKVKGLLATPVVVDARNLLDGAQLRRKGFQYIGVGRP